MPIVFFFGFFFAISVAAIWKWPSPSIPKFSWLTIMNCNRYARLQNCLFWHVLAAILDFEPILIIFVTIKNIFRDKFCVSVIIGSWDTEIPIFGFFFVAAILKMSQEREGSRVSVSQNFPVNITDSYSIYRKVSNIRRTKSQNLSVSLLGLQLFLYNRLKPRGWSQVFSGEWRCSWSSADRRSSNYIWVINNLIAH